MESEITPRAVIAIEMRTNRLTLTTARDLGARLPNLFLCLALIVLYQPKNRAFRRGFCHILGNPGWGVPGFEKPAILQFNPLLYLKYE